MKKLNAYQLKVICAVIMLLDHLAPFLGIGVSSMIHVVSRCVSPVFAYMVIEGLMHTRNVKRYSLRLFSWAIGMQLGNSLLNLFLTNRGVYLYNNIFMTLAFGLLGLALLKKAKELTQGKKSIITVIGILAASLGLFCEGGMVVIPFMLITFSTRERKKLRHILYALMSIILFSMSFTWYGNWQDTLSMLMYNSDFLFVLALPLIACYNGERGPNTRFNKYFFYVFYPLHLWVIALITYWRA